MGKTSVNLFDIAIGLAVTCQEKLSATVEKLVQKGELGRQQASEFLSAVEDKGAAGRKKITTQAQDSARKVLDEMGIVSTDEVAKLRKEIKELKALVKAKAD